MVGPTYRYCCERRPNPKRLADSRIGNATVDTVLEASPVDADESDHTAGILEFVESPAAFASGAEVDVVEALCGVLVGRV